MARHLCDDCIHRAAAPSYCRIGAPAAEAAKRGEPVTQCLAFRAPSGRQALTDAGGRLTSKRGRIDG